MKEVDFMLRACLWSGVNLKKSGAKVKRMEVWTPKSEGGLGLKSLKEWNKASMMQHLWALCKKADILWVKWVHSYIIKDQNFRFMKPPCDCSWTIRKLLKLTEVSQGFVKHVIGNGHGFVENL